MVSGPTKRRFASMPVRPSGEKDGALLEEHPHLVVPVDVVEREGDEAEFFGLLRIERRADGGLARGPDRTDRPGSAIAAASGRGSSDRARNSSRSSWIAGGLRLSPCREPISM